jgi:1,4-alpha-glucan branching enzyme
VTTLPPLDAGLVRAVAAGSHPQPHEVLGGHAVKGGTVVRVVRPLAATVDAVLPDGSHVALQHLSDGLWQGFHTGAPGPYRIVATYSDAPEWEADDPYRFPPTVGEVDLFLWGEGRHEQVWTMLGARVRTVDDVTGVGFAVWAPHAQAVRVIGDFNSWDGARHSMRLLGSGVWELFVPGVGVGTIYKYELLTPDGAWVKRADPMARRTEVPPATASVVD